MRSEHVAAPAFHTWYERLRFSSTTLSLRMLTGIRLAIDTNVADFAQNLTATSFAKSRSMWYRLTLVTTKEWNEYNPHLSLRCRFRHHRQMMTRTHRSELNIQSRLPLVAPRYSPCLANRRGNHITVLLVWRCVTGGLGFGAWIFRFSPAATTMSASGYETWILFIPHRWYAFSDWTRIDTYACKVVTV